jgi:Holliday junction DNA helicase RuvB
VPREALRILEGAGDIAELRGSPVISARDVELAAKGLEMEPDGLRRDEREILELLVERGGPMGLEAVAQALGLDPEAVREVHEPWLVRQGYLERTRQGRQATPAAWERLEGRLGGARAQARSPGNGRREAEASPPEDLRRGDAPPPVPPFHILR